MMTKSKKKSKKTIRKDMQERPLLRLDSEDEDALSHLIDAMDTAFHTSHHLQEARRQKQEEILRNISRGNQFHFDLSADNFNLNFSQTLEDDGVFRFRGAEDAFFQSGSLVADERIERKMRSDWDLKLKNPRYQSMLREREQLPMNSHRQEFLTYLHNNQVCVISGETGCGKSTQVPQMILEDSLAKGTASTTYIVVTQPRRISAISLAYRVKDELAEPSLGLTVGYQIRLEAKRPRERGGILYCTNGILLKWLIGDRHLRRISHIVLDEIHERDINSDFLLIVVRDLLETRKDLKVILMSATLNARLFSEYFNGAPMLGVKGRVHRVTPHFLEETMDRIGYSPRLKLERGRRRIPESIRTLPISSREKQLAAESTWAEMGHYAESLRGMHKPGTLSYLRYRYDEDFLDLELILHLCRYIDDQFSPEEALLIFLPGWDDISRAVKRFRETEFGVPEEYWVIPLHSRLPSLDQRRVFQRPGKGCRKIVVATNIAETSITVTDVVHVIDCGKVKIKNFDVERDTQTLRAEWVSRANVDQRRGRAGRVQEGHCWHLFTNWRYHKFQRFLLPEMLRTRLDNMCLQIKALGLGDIHTFLSKAPEPPSLQSINLAMEELRGMGALEEKQALTPLGWHMSKLPVDPHCGKMIIYGAIFGCLDPILTIAACLDYKDPFYTPMFMEEEADEAKSDIVKDFPDLHSDHLLWVLAIQEYRRRRKELTPMDADSWAKAHFLSVSTMTHIHRVKDQLARELRGMGFLQSGDYLHPSSNHHSSELFLISAVACAGLYPRVAEAGPSAERVSFRKKNLLDVVCHPRSINAYSSQIVTRYVVYHEMMRSGRLYLSDSGMISPFTLILFGGELDFLRSGSGGVFGEIRVDEWIRFFCTERMAGILRGLRRELMGVIQRRIIHPRPVGDAEGGWEADMEKEFMDILVEYLREEDIYVVDGI